MSLGNLETLKKRKHELEAAIEQEEERLQEIEDNKVAWFVVGIPPKEPVTKCHWPVLWGPKTKKEAQAFIDLRATSGPAKGEGNKGTYYLVSPSNAPHCDKWFPEHGY